MDACPSESERASERAYICFLYILLGSFLYPHVHTLKTLTHAAPLPPKPSCTPQAEENQREPSENHHYCRLTNAAIYTKRSRLPSTFAASLTLSPLARAACLSLQTIDTNRYTPPPPPRQPPGSTGRFYPTIHPPRVTLREKKQNKRSAVQVKVRK